MLSVPSLSINSAQSGLYFPQWVFTPNQLGSLAINLTLSRTNASRKNQTRLVNHSARHQIGIFT